MLWLIAVVLVGAGVVALILLTEGRYFGKPLVRWAYDRWGENMFPNTGSEATWARLINALRLDGDEYVLDVGTSTGALPLMIAATRDFTGRAFGMDWSQKLIGLAREEAVRRGVDDLTTFLVGDARNPLPFNDASLDVVVCLGVVEGLPHPRRVLAEFTRVLRPGGTLAVSCYRPHPITPTLSRDWYGEQLAGYECESVRLRRSHEALLFKKPESHRRGGE